MNPFDAAFADNYYLTGEYAAYCSKIAGVPLRNIAIHGQTFPVLRNKVIAISNYSESLSNELRRRKAAHLRVLPAVNGQDAAPSLMEYSLFHWTTYEEAVKKYRTSFVHGLREGRKYPHAVDIVPRPAGRILDQTYGIYLEQMKRHNSYVLPRSLFQAFGETPSSFLFLIRSGDHITAFFLCFGHKSNIYASIGGGDPRFFSTKCSNKLYDELIRYACQNGCTIHLGLGEYGSGYQQFKKNAGLVCYKTERYPDTDRWLRLAVPLLRFRLTGRVLAAASALLPHRIAYYAMPFT